MNERDTLFEHDVEMQLHLFELAAADVDAQMLAIRATLDRLDIDGTGLAYPFVDDCVGAAL